MFRQIVNKINVYVKTPSRFLRTKLLQKKN